MMQILDMAGSKAFDDDTKDGTQEPLQGLVMVAAHTMDEEPYIGDGGAHANTS
jgi:hypothetical protein